MKLIRTEDAVGHVLCHDMTQIIINRLPFVDAAGFNLHHALAKL